jgi:hypothetical protein
MEGFENFSDKYCFHRIRSTLLVLSNTVLVLHNLVLVLVLVLVLSAQCSVLVLVLSAQCNGTRTRKQLAAVVYSFNTRPTPECD